MSDLNRSTLSYVRKDADFHILQERLGSNVSTETFIFTNQIELGKFLPQNLGIAFPVNVTYNMQNNTPKFLPGTDIRTGSSAPDSVITQSSTISMNGKISKKIKSENPFIRYTIDNLSTTFNASTQNRYDEIMKRVDTDRFTTSLDYNLRFPSDNYIEAFQWLEKVPIVGDSMSKTKFFYTPSSFNSSIKLNQSFSEKQSRSVEEVIDDFNLGLTLSLIHI